MKARTGLVQLLPAFVAVLISGCGGPTSGRGFTLPEGDVDRGKTAFLNLKCYSCHRVSGEELPAPDETTRKAVLLGGTTPRIQTYGELVTSIINPSHKLAQGFVSEPATDQQAAEGEPQPKSPMVNNNDVMTVSQLIDLVKFLQSHYELEPYDPTLYQPY